MAGLLILWLAATPHPAPQPGNECRIFVTGLYLPCSKVGPTQAKFRQAWIDEGQDI
jgi:hypothetical protein